MRRAGHIGRIVLAYSLSCLLPALWFGLGNVSLRNYDDPPWQLVVERLLTDVVMIGTIVGAYMAVPALAAIWLAERRRWISPVPYVIFGTCAPVLMILLLGLPELLSGDLKMASLSLFGRMAVEFGLLGLISGLSYWAVAGRRSGWSGIA